MKKLLLTSLALGVLGAAPALAADLGRPAPMPMKAPPPAAAYIWTGCYIGGNVGGIWERDTTTITAVDAGSGIGPAILAGVVPVNFTYDRSSWLAGGQIGCNYQFASWAVVGIESDIDATRLNGGQTINTAVPTFFPVTSTVNQNMKWIGTTRGRLGVAWNNVLFYGTAGVAYGNVSNSYFQSNVPAGPVLTSFSDSSTQVGWTAGGGIEVGFGPWSVKGEALWYDLGTHALTGVLACTTATGICPGDTAAARSTVTAHFQDRGVIARIGLNYRFGWGGAGYASY